MSDSSWLPSKRPAPASGGGVPGVVAVDEQPQSKRPKKSGKKKKTAPDVLEFRRTVQQCCKTNNLGEAMRAYDKAIEHGTHIEPQSFYNLLNLCDGFGNRGLHIGTPKPMEDTTTKQHVGGNNDGEKLPEETISAETRVKHAERIKAQMDRLQLPLTETAYSALVKLYSKIRNVDQALGILDKAETVQQCKPKLRLYAPLLAAYCDMGRMVDGLKIWQRLAKQELLPSEKEYAELMKCSTTVGNAAVLERVLSDLSEDVLVPSKETCRTICDWFASKHAVTEPTLQAKEPNGDETIALINKTLEEIKLPYTEQAANMGPVQCTQDQGGWTVSQTAGIDKASGRLLSGCLKDEHLQPIALSDECWETMKKMNETIVNSGRLEGDTSEFQGGKKGRKKQLGRDLLENRRFHWTHFQKYLDDRLQHQKIDVVIDGANVGYEGHNFAGAPKHVDYEKIDWVVQQFRRQNKSVLLVMHSRHFSRNLMPRQMEPLMKSWLDTNVLYRTPPGMNDDWFWLHAALVSGPGTLVVTNDEMRDHHFQMLAPRYFLRWKDRHQVHFSFGPFEQTARRRSVDLTYPERYSRRIQRVQDGLVIPLPKKGDTNRFLDGNFVVDEDDAPEEETYLCIRPKRSPPAENSIVEQKQQ